MNAKLNSPILIATTLTPASDALVRTGMTVAARLGLAPLLVHAAEVPNALPPVATTADILAEGDWRDRLRDQAEEDLRDQATRLGIFTAGGDILCRLGSAEKVLLDAATEFGASLLVVGRGESARRWHLLSTTPDRLVRRACCQVLVVSPDAAFPPRRALAPVDLTVLSGGALRSGLTFLRRLGLPAVATDVLFSLDPAERRGSLQFSEAQMESFAKHELDHFVEAHGGAEAPTLARRLTVAKPRDGILNAIEEIGADLVIVGTHSRRGLDRLLLGSVAAAIVQAAPTSLLVVPPEVAAAALDEHHAGPDWEYIADSEHATAAHA